MSNGIVYHNQLLTTLVTKWSPFGHRVLGHRFLKDIAHAQKLIIYALLKGRLLGKDE